MPVMKRNNGNLVHNSPLPAKAEQRVGLSVCISVSLSVPKFFWTTHNNGTSIELPTDLKLYKDQNKRQAFF